MLLHGKYNHQIYKLAGLNRNLLIKINFKDLLCIIWYFQIWYDGDDCRQLNFSYHVAFASIFFLLALTSLIQLAMCIHAGKEIQNATRLKILSIYHLLSFRTDWKGFLFLQFTEYLRMKKHPSILRACRITTQKFLYFAVFLAALLRGTYFAAPVSK